MQYAFFLGCTTPSRLKEYESSSRAILKEFGVDLADIQRFNCCGYPLKHVDLKASLLSTARNLALAEKEQLPILSLCQCGYGTLKQGIHALKENPALKEELNAILAGEGLAYEGTGEVVHLLTVLHRHVGVEKISKRISQSFKDLKIATHYGCHGLRPSEIVAFDDPISPTVFDQLVSATGAESIPWSEKLACCGGPLAGINDDLSARLTTKKMASAEQAGAHFIATACPFCQIQFRAVREERFSKNDANHCPPPLLYSQLLGFSMGLDQQTLGMNDNDRLVLKRFVEQ